jgi:hypothetical protein
VIALASAFALSFGFVSVAAAADLACHPDVKVTNKKPIAIKVLRFSYTADGDFNEGLANKKLSPGESHTWKSQKLQGVAVGNSISATKIEFKDDTSGAKSLSDPWGPPKWSKSFPQGGDCKDTSTYVQVIE